MQTNPDAGPGPELQAAANRTAPGRTLVILNPAAGRARRARERIHAAFAERHVRIELVETSAPKHATELARDAALDGFSLVVAAGGDGTLAEVLAGLEGTGVPAALIPRGTGNQVAHNLQIPQSLEQAVDLALSGSPTKMDLGRADGQIFALTAGAGYDAAVMLRATRALKKRLGFGAYIYAVVHEALKAKPVDFRLVVDGEELCLGAISVLVANMGELFVGALPMPVPLSPHRGRSWQDGLLDLLVIAPEGYAEVPGVIWQVLRRRFRDERGLFHTRASSVTVEADGGAPIEIDGDARGTTPFTAEAVPAGAIIMLSNA